MAKKLKSNIFETEKQVEETKVEISLEDEIKGSLENWRDMAKYEEQLIRQNTSTDYYFVVYFNNEQQKAEFMDKLKIDDIQESYFINGGKLAKRLNITLTSPSVKTPGKFKSLRQNSGLEFIE
jgi:hypothetical protein